MCVTSHAGRYNDTYVLLLYWPAFQCFLILTLYCDLCHLVCYIFLSGTSWLVFFPSELIYENKGNPMAPVLIQAPHGPPAFDSTHFHVLKSATISAYKICSVRIYPHFLVWQVVFYFWYLFMLVYNSGQHVLTIWVTWRMSFCSSF